MKITLTISLLLTSCAAASAATELPTAFGFVYDAATRRGPCPVSEIDYRKVQNLTRPGKEAKPEDSFLREVFGRAVCAKHPFIFKDANALNLLVLNPRFRADYSAAVVTQNQKSDGIVAIRGLTDVTSANVIAQGLPGLQGTPAIAAPVAHGGRQPSTVTIAPMTPAQVLAQMVDESQSGQVLLTLAAQARDLADAEHTQQLDQEEYFKAVKRISQGGGGADCVGLSGAPDVETLKNCVANLVKQIVLNYNAQLKPDVPHPGCNRTIPDTGQPWLPEEFDCIVTLTDLRIADLAVLRGRLAEYGFRAISDKIETECEALVAKLGAFQTNLDLVARTVEDFMKLRGAAAEAMPKIRRAEIKKQLKDKYGTVLDEAELNELARLQEAGVDNKDFEKTFKDNVAELQSQIGQWRDQTEGKKPQSESKKPQSESKKRSESPDLPSIASIRAREKDVRERAFDLAAAVDAMNSEFALLFNSINNVYLTKSNPWSTVVAIDLSTGSGGNRDVFCVLKSDELFKPYQFTATIPTPATQQGGPLVTATPNPVLSATPANLPVNIKQAFDFEMHKFWHANVVSGFVFSSLANRQYALQTVTVTQNGTATPQNVPVLANEQIPTAHYLLGICYYIKERDTYMRSKQATAGNWFPGILGGVGVESSKNFFIGPNFEPVMGIDLSIGLHYGEQTALQPQYPLGTPLPAGATAVPTRTVMGTGVYGMIGFDLNIFRRIFGAATGTK